MQRKRTTARWAPSEERLVVEAPTSDQELAQMLGRSIGAIGWRREQLKNGELPWPW